jgi:glucokinase
MTDIIIGVDLGGTQIRAARLDQRLHILTREQTLTLADQGLEATLDRIKNLIRAVWPQDGARVAGIGISAPGPLNPATGIIVAPPNLPGWHNVPLRDILQEAFSVPVYVGNDANVAALAETARGAAHGFRHVIYITVSTGIGGGVIMDGRLLLGKDGLAAEVGHMVMVVDGTVTTLEKEAAGPALAKQARAQIERGEKSLIHELVKGDLSQISAKTVGQAAEAGDALALEVVRRGGRIVGLGITTLLHLFNPEIVVIGGGVSKLGELLFAPMREAFQRYTIDTAYWSNLRIERAALGDDVSIVGAAALVVTQGGLKEVYQAIAQLDEDEKQY